MRMITDYRSSFTQFFAEIHPARWQNGGAWLYSKLLSDRKWRDIMKTRRMLFIMALLGVFGSGRLGDAQDSSAPQTGLPQTQKGLPLIDAAVPAKTETATFAMG